MTSVSGGVSDSTSSPPSFRKTRLSFSPLFWSFSRPQSFLFYCYYFLCFSRRPLCSGYATDLHKMSWPLSGVKKAAQAHFEASQPSHSTTTPSHTLYQSEIVQKNAKGCLRRQGSNLCSLGNQISFAWKFKSDALTTRPQRNVIDWRGRDIYNPIDNSERDVRKRCGLSNWITLAPSLPTHHIPLWPRRRCAAVRVPLSTRALLGRHGQSVGR
jgi:hypothetical protein